MAGDRDQCSALGTRWWNSGRQVVKYKYHADIGRPGLLWDEKCQRI